MASKMAMCDPCSRLNKSSEGIKVCTDCEDVLCTDCVAIHSAVKILAAHHLVDLSVSAEYEFQIKRNCSDHEGMCFEFYCSDHDCLICRTCMANTHRTCGKIQPIDVAAKGCRSSAMVEDITKEITSLLNATKELVVDRQENKTRVGEIKAKVLKHIAKIRQDIDYHLDQLEKKLIFEVDTLDKTIREKACNDLCEAEKRQNDIKGMWQKVDFFTQHGSESQLFIHLNTVKPDVSKQAQSFQDLMSRMESNDIDLEGTDFASVIKSCGSVKIKSSSCTVAYQPPKQMQAQSSEKSHKVPSEFELETKIEVPAGRITCIVATNENKLLLCNDALYKNNVLLWTEKGEHLKSCTVAGKPFSIATVPGTDEAVVTLGFLNLIQFINISSLTPCRKDNIEVPSPYGVAVTKDSIYVGSKNGKVFIINRKSKKCLKTLDIGRSYISSIMPFFDNRFYCCEYGAKDLVSCIKLDGTCVFSCPVNGPTTLALDTKGNSYVTGYDSHDLHRFSPDGKVDNVILKKSDGLRTPLAVAFNKTFNKLFISNDDAKNVMIFNCK